jgi:short-subunit dehydrogenase
MSNPKVVLVTGVSSGIGRETAQLLVKKGFQVFGTARDPHMVEAIAGVEVIELDVTNGASVDAAVKTLLEKAGQIYALINNAGYALVGALEETNLEEAREQFETNFFGVMRMINAILPAMRQQGTGRIVNISSVLGVIPAPYMGIYTASKHAIEGYSETLDYEVRQFGIRVSLVEPGFTKTNLGVHGQGTATTLDDYAAERKQVLAAIQRQISNGANPRSVAESIHHALTADHPRLRYRVGGSTNMVIALKSLLPEEAFHEVIRRIFQVNQTMTVKK